MDEKDMETSARQWREGGGQGGQSHFTSTKEQQQMHKPQTWKFSISLIFVHSNSLAFNKTQRKG